MLAGTVRWVFFFIFPAILIAPTPSDSFLLRQRRAGLHPRLILSCGQDHCLGEGEADLGPWPSPSRLACGVGRQGSTRPSPPAPDAASHRPALLVPTPAEAQPGPRPSPAPVRPAGRAPQPRAREGPRQRPRPAEGSKASPLHGILVFAFCSSSGADDVLAPQHRLGMVVPAWQPVCRGLSACAASRQPGRPCARARRRGEQGAGGEGAGPGIHACVHPYSRPRHSAFLIKISLRMIHTGESVWMDSLMASSGPKDGSTSPSATPLEKEPIWM